MAETISAFTYCEMKRLLSLMKNEYQQEVVDAQLCNEPDVDGRVRLHCRVVVKSDSPIKEQIKRVMSVDFKHIPTLYTEQVVPRRTIAFIPSLPSIPE